MRIDTKRIYAYCRTVPQAELAQALGVSRQTLRNRLKNLDNLTVVEFFKICEVLEEPYENFLIKGGQS